MWFTHVPMSGIEPLLEGYESSVLPLNYTGMLLGSGAGFEPAISSV